MKAPDPRAELYANAMKVGRETSDMTRAALLHMRLYVLANDLSQVVVLMLE
jgi:hypothetical protein